MNKVVILVLIGIASVGIGMVLAQKIIQPQTTVQDGSAQPAVQEFPQLQGGCCGQSTATGQPAVRQVPSLQAEVQNTAAQPVQVGNRICPVSGRPIGVMGPGVQEEYKGKIYTLCCGGCIGRFESDPEGYSKIADDEVKGQAQ